MVSEQNPVGSPFGYRATAREVVEGIDLAGKRIVVTGVAEKELSSDKSKAKSRSSLSTSPIRPLSTNSPPRCRAGATGSMSSSPMPR